MTFDELWGRWYADLMPWMRLNAALREAMG